MGSEPRVSATVIPLRRRRGVLEVGLVRRNSALVFHGGEWVFPGGRIDATDEGATPLDRARAAASREALEEAQLRLDPKELFHHAHWTTPEMRPRRYATDYFLAWVDAPLRPDGSEIVDAQWVRPERALMARDQGTLVLPPPTFATIWRLAHEGESLFEQPPLRILPKPKRVEDGFVSLYNGDAGYLSGDLNVVGPRHRVALRASGWRYERSDSVAG